MSKYVYVIQMCDAKKYREEGKLGHKIADMSCYVRSSTLYGITDKAAVIAECRDLNRKDKICMIYYPVKIDIY